jgi:hypothetical protein
MYAGAPESRRLTARVYGDGSLACTLGSGARLSWKNGRGSIEGNHEGYDVYAWKQIG